MTDYSVERLEEFTPPPSFQRLLSSLESFGFGNCVLRGGALRDVYLGIPEKINDLDIWADFGQLRKPDETFEEFAERIRSGLMRVVGSRDVNVTTYTLDNPPGFEALNITFHSGGHKISMGVNNMPAPIEQKIYETDAPINSIAMNSRGEVFCHPDFVEHANERIYEPLPHVAPERARERFNNLLRKVPDLIMRTRPNGTALLPSAPVPEPAD